VASKAERAGSDRSERTNGRSPIRWALGFVRRHPRLSISAAVLGIGLVVFVLLWFEPQKLFLNQTVNEAIPSAAPPAAGADAGEGSGEQAGSGSGTVTGPLTLASGAFRSLEHSTSGEALLIELPDGSHILRFENLDTSNGPDLRVYLSEIPASDDWHAYGVRFVDLGALKGNLGSQNYRIPKGVDVSTYRSAVIWCRRFTVGFGVAPLMPA
jgi:Electron transfer DM13